MIKYAAISRFFVRHPPTNINPRFLVDYETAVSHLVAYRMTGKHPLDTRVTYKAFNPGDPHYVVLVEVNFEKNTVTEIKE